MCEGAPVTINAVLVARLNPLVLPLTLDRIQKRFETLLDLHLIHKSSTYKLPANVAARTLQVTQAKAG